MSKVQRVFPTKLYSTWLGPMRTRLTSESVVYHTVVLDDGRWFLSEGSEQPCSPGDNVSDAEIAASGWELLAGDERASDFEWRGVGKIASYEFSFLESNRLKAEAGFLHFAIAAPKNEQRGRYDNEIGLLSIEDKALRRLTDRSSADPIALFLQHRDYVVHVCAEIFLRKQTEGDSSVRILDEDILSLKLK